MVISGVSSLGTTNQIVPPVPTSNSQSPFSLFGQLASALKSGNLASAQQAYNSLASLTQSTPAAQSNAQVSSDFTALGQALQSGNLQAAQQSFANLQQAALQGFASHGHHHHGGGGGGSSLLQISASNNPAESLLTSPSTSSSSGTNSSANSQNNNSSNLLDLLI